MKTLIRTILLLSALSIQVSGDQKADSSKVRPIQITIVNQDLYMPRIYLGPMHRRLYDEKGKEVGLFSNCPQPNLGYRESEQYCILTPAGGAQFASDSDAKIVFDIITKASTANPVTVVIDPETHMILKVKAHSMGKYSFVSTAPGESLRLLPDQQKGSMAK